MFCSLIFYFIPGYELSDDEDQYITPSQIQDLKPDDTDRDHPSDVLLPPAPLMALPPPPPPTFDFHSFMRKSGGKLIQELDALLPQGFIIAHSQHAGSGVRLLYLAYFAYSAFHLYHFLFLFRETKRYRLESEQ